MRTDFTRRLELVSNRLAAEQPPGGRGLDQLAKIKLLLLSHYEGQLEPHESVVSGLARALGYGRMADFNVALQEPGHEALNERIAAAMDRLFRSHGHDPARMTGEAFGQFIGTLVEGLPPELMARVGLDPRGPTDE